MDILIPYQKKLIPASVHIPSEWEEKGNHVCVILTHGAGGDKDFHQLKHIAHSIINSGVMCVRFTCKGLNIKYRTKVYAAVLNHISETYPIVDQFILGGRSMGSRSVVNVANCVLSLYSSKDNAALKNTEVTDNQKKDPIVMPKKKRKLYKKDDLNTKLPKDSDVKQICENCHIHHLNLNIIGVFCISYPLQALKSNDFRSIPLLALKAPALFISGTKDKMCEIDLLCDILSKVSINGNYNKKLIDKDFKTIKLSSPLLPFIVGAAQGADHSLKIDGVNNKIINNEISVLLVEWIKLLTEI